MIGHNLARQSLQVLRPKLFGPQSTSVSLRRLANMATQKTSHVERTATEPRENKLHNVQISHIEQVNDRIRLFRLELLTGPTKFLAGQWLDTYVPGIDKAGGFTLTCPPSAAAAPTGADEKNKPYLELAVQKSPDNPPAAWLWRPAAQILGETLRVRIGGAFVFPSQAIDSLGPVRKLVLVAGGVGVNPLVSMLGHIADTPSLAAGMEVKMAYASKAAGGDEALMREVVFLDRITKAFGEGRVRGSLSLYVTGRGGATEPNRMLDVNGTSVEVYSRRVSVDDVKSIIGKDKSSVQSSLVYICGPAAMTDEFEGALTAEDGLAMDQARVMTEKWW